MNRDPGRVLRFRGNAERLELPRTRVIAKGVNALARRLGRIGAHVGQIVIPCRMLLLRFSRGKQKKGAERKCQKPSRHFHDSVEPEKNSPASPRLMFASNQRKSNQGVPSGIPPVFAYFFSSSFSSWSRSEERRVGKECRS